MQRDEVTVGPELVGARALRAWITGEQEEHSRVFLVESGAAVDGVEGVAGRDDVILLPRESGAYEGPARTVRYSGALHEVGDELFFGERGVELQDYIAASFVQIIGPTAVRFFDGSSWQAFLDDAELARRTGVFPSALIDPRVLLADRTAVATPDELRTPSALRLTRDGGVGIGVQGGIIGDVDELPALLSVRLPRIAALRGVGPTDALASDLRARDWLGRYLAATDLMKMLRLANGAAQLSGFGCSLFDDGHSDAEPLTADPFLLETADGFVLADTTTLRRQLLSPVTAEVVAVTQTSSSTEFAAQRVARRLGMSTSDAHALCVEALAALSIHVGRRADAVGATNGVER